MFLFAAGGETTRRRLPSNERRKKSKLTESLQTLMGSLGKKKGDKLKRALTDLTAGTDSDQAVVAGTYNEKNLSASCRHIMRPSA